MIGHVLAAQGQICGVLAQGRRPSAAAADWWLAGGVDPAQVAAVWSPIDAVSQAASYLRLAGDEGYANIDPAVVGIGVAPTWASGVGWTFNGTTQYLTTGVVPASGWSAIVRLSNRTSTSGYVLGIGQTTNQFFTFIPTGTGILYGNGGLLSASPPFVAGILAVAGQKAYRNGVVEAGTIGSWVGTTALGMYIGAGNRGTAQNFLAGNIQAIALYRPPALTAGQVLAISTEMALLT